MFKMDNRCYDKLKFVAQIALPAFATFMVTFCEIWGISGGDKISGTIMAVDLLLGAILGISSSNYKKDVDALSRIGWKEDEKR